uniref:CCWamide neuropeptide n=1 Tax=Platynereis dumerilii TaxID=6359 RepID=V5TBX4_PLADU|nr:CCWamide neuropeptide precursor [Platynereis dumerilii]
MRWIIFCFLIVLFSHTVLCWRIQDFANTDNEADDDDTSARYRQERRLLDYLRDVKRRHVKDRQVQKPPYFLTCSAWQEPCDPWTNNVHTQCCDEDGLVCKCNFWAQNCKCVSRLWGR